MDNNEGPPFPLMRLPHKILDYVFTFFHVLELLSLSLTSRRASALVKPSVIQRFQNCDRFEISVINQMTILFYMHFGERTLTVSVSKNEGRDMVEATFGGIRDEFRVLWPQLDARHYATHLMDVTKRDIVDLLSVFSEMNNLESLGTVTNGLRLTNILFLRQISEQTIMETLQHHPRTKTIHLDHKGSDETFKNISMRNWNKFSVLHGEKIKLNELLICNGKYISFRYSSLSMEDLHRFVKLWIEGSNNRLERLELGFTDSKNETLLRNMDNLIDHLLERITRRQQNDHEMRIFHNDSGNVSVENGYEISARDGTQAILNFVVEHGAIYFKMFVWRL